MKKNTVITYSGGGFEREVSSGREIFENKEDRIKILETILSITKKVNSGLMVDEILDYIFEEFQAIIPYDRMSVAFLEEDCKIVTLKWAMTKGSVIKLKPNYSAFIEGSSLEQILITGCPRIINNLKTYLKEKPDSKSTKLIMAEGMMSNLTCPIISKGKTAGLIFFTSTVPDIYDISHIEIFLNLAEQISMILEKGRLYEEVLRLNEAKSKFLSIAAHDIRSPVAIIKSCSDLLLQGYTGNLSKDQEEVINEIDRSCKNMLELIDDFLDFSVIEAGKLEIRPGPVEIGDFLKECCSYNKILAKDKNIEIKLHIKEDCNVLVDPCRLKQVINNLLTNAMKFSPENSVITVETKKINSHMEVSVHDEGPGIEKEEVTKIFEEYCTGKRKLRKGEKSTGLGLAICKCIIKAHDGEIWVESNAGKGSSFKFTIPVA